MSSSSAIDYIRIRTMPARSLTFRWSWDGSLADFGMVIFSGCGLSSQALIIWHLRFRFSIWVVQLLFKDFYLHFAPFTNSRQLCSCCVVDLCFMRTFQFVTLGYCSYCFGDSQYLHPRGGSSSDSFYSSLGSFGFGSLLNFLNSSAGSILICFDLGPWLLGKPEWSALTSSCRCQTCQIRMLRWFRLSKTLLIFRTDLLITSYS